MSSMYKARAERLFSGLSAKTLQAFETIKHVRAYHKGALLFVEGQSPHGIFVLSQGRVKLILPPSHGKARCTEVAGPGDVLGLSAAISGRPYEVSAETSELCHVDFVKREDFVHFVKEHSDLCLKVLEQLAEKHRAISLEIISRTKSVNERLARLLLEWRPKNVMSFAQQARIDLALSHEEIAERIGVTRETVSRAFSELKKRGIVRGKGSTWVICNEPALKEIAGSYGT